MGTARAELSSERRRLDRPPRSTSLRRETRPGLRIVIPSDEFEANSRRRGASGSYRTDMTKNQNFIKSSAEPATGRRNRPLSWLVAVGVIAAIALTGCTAQPDVRKTTAESVPDGSTLAALSLPAKNIEQSVLPLNKFMLDDTKNSDYAENLLIEPCMVKAGFDWNVPWRDTRSNDGPSWNDAHMRLFTLALAKQWGFRIAPSSDPSLTALRSFQREKATISSAEKTALTSCLSQARKELPILPGSAQRATTFAQAAYESAQKDKTVLRAAAAWKKCMVPAGISDLPDLPTRMPSDSIIRRFNIKFDISNIPPQVTQEEITLATTDFECRNKAGYEQALYDAQWSRQATLLAENADELNRVAAQISKHTIAVLAVIASHAPSR